MNLEYTLSILKPDAIKRNITGKVNSYIENAGLKIIAQKTLLLTTTQAENFYIMHKDSSYYQSLVQNMTSGIIIAQVLYGLNAVKKYREIMGATNPIDAKKGTIRGDIAKSIDENTVHGSDSLESAAIEIQFFFALIEYAYH
ncbi:nucleoside diphosphate kinase [Orientia chuto str. Dubai]|uniref:Nucleoside diphosphate kinase n=1 Tax=Orientia chuto str. Dubai TaxID=1359168 RepID=A0A0F3MMQ8_9RICK|nr:nucleoside-diphosphate kinase [Candidatus Orientia mediorientalis]KJV56742.1 nucleoside diphosphate kinase [Orientia chuto str. Dubai]